MTASLNSIVAIPPCERPSTLRLPAPADSRRQLAGETMGTTWSVQLYGPPTHTDDDFRTPIERELDEIVRQMSHWRADSDLSRFNHLPAGTWAALPKRFLDVLTFSLKVASDTGGAFDPTIGPLVNEWGFGPEQKPRAVPAEDTLARQSQRCGWSRLDVDATQAKARHAGGLGLDLSAVAKGYAVDQVARLLEQSGVPSYLVEIGGELRASGIQPGGHPWWVAIEPPAPDAFPDMRVALSGWSIATSGDYRRYFVADGKRWTHTIDPRTGQSLSGDLASVTVVHPECMACDAYSTALMVMGVAEGMEYAEQRGLAALFILRNDEGFVIRCSEAFYQMLE